eukprot:1157111-Pelagomonas_calceolata.AAC.5
MHGDIHPLGYRVAGPDVSLCGGVAHAKCIQSPDPQVCGACEVCLSSQVNRRCYVVRAHSAAAAGHTGRADHFHICLPYTSHFSSFLCDTYISGIGQPHAQGHSWLFWAGAASGRASAASGPWTKHGTRASACKKSRPSGALIAGI